MSLKTNALIEVSEIETLLGITDDETEDAKFEFFINAASQGIEQLTGRKWITPEAAETIYHNGTGTARIFLRNIPIVTITSISYRSSSDDWTAVTSDWTYLTLEESGLIVLTDGNIFQAGDKNWKFVLTYGTTRANVPYDLKFACAFWTYTMKRQFDERLAGTRSKSFGDQSVTFDFGSPPKEIRSIIENRKYKGV